MNFWGEWGRETSDKVILKVNLEKQAEHFWK